MLLYSLLKIDGRVMGKRLSEEQAFLFRFRSASCVSSSESTSAGRGDFEACSNDIYDDCFLVYG